MKGPTIFGAHEPKTLAQLADVASRAERAALMADGHLGYVMPIGGVAAYRNRVSVVGVGFDIACGNCAIRTDRSLAELSRPELETIANEIEATISFGIGRRNQSDDAPVDHPLFEDPAWEAIPAVHREDLRHKARAQLGTVGSGNHYVDVLADEAGQLWIGVHFGSRGLGHTVASGFLALSQGKGWRDRAPEREVLLDVRQPMGHDYYALMELAGRYAYAGREWVARKAVSILGGVEHDLVHNHHNYSWREEIGGEEYFVVRKGATPAYPGQRGFVGGSMGDDSVILRGSTKPAARELQEAALFSTVHGAGRVMSRSEAAGKVKRGSVWACGDRDCRTTLPTKAAPRGPGGSLPRCPSCGSKMHKRESREITRPGKVTPEMMTAWLADRGVILRGGGLDESPHAYRRLPEVLAAQGETIEIEHTLRPIVVVMAGMNEFDPYQD
jgi:tRNA-splicing ligase RtcB